MLIHRLPDIEGVRRFSIACSQRGPKLGTFARYLEMLLQHLKFPEDYHFRVQPFDGSIPVDYTQLLDFVGTTSLSIDPSNEAAANLLRQFGFNPDETRSLGLVIRPKKDHSIADRIVGLFRSLGGNSGLSPEELGITRFHLRAKAALQDDMTDFYLTATGKLHHVIPRGTESEIINHLVKGSRNNGTVRTQLQKLQSLHDYKEADIRKLCRGWNDLDSDRDGLDS